MQPNIKTQTFGISTSIVETTMRQYPDEIWRAAYPRYFLQRSCCWCWVILMSLCCPQCNSYLPEVPGTHQAEEEAYINYREMRENGTEDDNPPRPFPKDGKFTWIDVPTSSGVGSKCRYTEGIDDAAWMAEKDRIYLARLEQEERTSILSSRFYM